MTMEPAQQHQRRKSITFLPTLPSLHSHASLEEARPLLSSRSFHGYQSMSTPVSPTTSYITLPNKRLRASKSHLSVANTAKGEVSHLLGPSVLEKERIWYDNYTAIDWIHDAVQDAHRATALRALPGFRGRVIYAFDAIQGWILALLTGVLSACIVYLVMICEAFLFSIKNGYCKDDPWVPHSYCRTGQFIYWSDNSWLQFTIYLGFALAFCLSASLMTLTTMTTFPSGKKLYMAAGSGIPEVKTILSGFVIHGFLGVRTLVVKAVGLTLAVASGLNLGKEGPCVHIATCTCNILSRYFSKFNNNESKRREAFSAACAAGVAVAFGAPVGGVLFALEEVSYYFPQKVMWRSFFCAGVAAVTLKVLNPHGTGKLVLLETNYEKDWHVRELPVFVLIGVFGGLYGAAFCNLNMMWARWFRSFKLVAKHPVIEVFFICFLTTVVSYWNRYTRMGGTELVRELLGECHEGIPSELCPDQLQEYTSILNVLTGALLNRAILTTVTFGCKIPAGIFVPTMCVGALFGRIIGTVLERIELYTFGSWLMTGICDSSSTRCIVPGIYAMVGAAATLAGVTRMTVSLAVIMFELCGSLDYIMPTMVTIIVAKWVADAIQPKGIYDLLIELNDHPYLDAKISHTFEHSALVDILPTRDVMLKTSLDVTSQPMVKASTLRAKVNWTRELGAEDSGFTLLSSGQLIGYIALADLSLALDLLPVGVKDADVIIDPRADTISCANSLYNSSMLDDEADLADFRYMVDRAPLTISKESPLELALELFTKLGLRYVCIVDGAEFMGVIHKKSFVRYLRQLER